MRSWPAVAIFALLLAVDSHAAFDGDASLYEGSGDFKWRAAPSCRAGSSGATHRSMRSAVHCEQTATRAPPPPPPALPAPGGALTYVGPNSTCEPPPAALNATKAPAPECPGIDNFRCSTGALRCVRAYALNARGPPRSALVLVHWTHLGALMPITCRRAITHWIACPARPLIGRSCVLEKAMGFFEAQRSGKISDNLTPW